MNIGIAAGGLGVALTLLALLLVSTQAAVFGQAPPPFPQVPPEKRLFDADGNKVFDNLEALIAPAAPGEPFEVIVLFQQPLETLDFEGLQQQMGIFQAQRRFHSINGISTVLTKAQILEAAALEEVRQIEFNNPVFLHLDGAREWSGVDQARTDFGTDFGIDGNTDGSPTYSKDDIVIAIIDTGIDTGHVDLDGDKVIGWKDFIDDLPDPYDEGNSCVYHGTHVASIAAGEGEGDSAFQGVAPGAALVGLKVLTHFPQFGGFCGGSTADINAAIQWVIDNKLRNSGTEGGDAPDAGINVANMSLGSAGCSDGTDSMSLLVDQAVEAGVVMALSAGNEGPGSCTIGSPAAAEKAVTVGAMADVDEDGFVLISFSSRGPTADDRIKPDIASPGVTIMAASGGTTSGYKNLSGTSMSSPFTAGTAALILHANPALSALEVKDLLMLTARDWGPLDGATHTWTRPDGTTHSGPRSDIDWGAGRLDAYQAIKAALEPAGVFPNIDLPQHQFFEDSLTEDGGGGDEDFYIFTITDTTLPIAATLIMPTWDSGQPDFDMQLRDNDDNLVASSGTVSRQETIRFAPPTDAGPYTLRVFAWPGGGGSSASVAGPYLLDISVGTATVSISITTDGFTPFGSQEPGVSIDTTSTGTNDVQTVQVNTGPVDLYIRTTLFTDGENTWALGTTSDPDQVIWEFFDGTDWTTFTAANTLFPLATGVAQGTPVDVFFRLTMPTDTTSLKEHGVSITIVAVEPGDPPE